jgi:hypothetical protein
MPDGFAKFIFGGGAGVSAVLLLVYGMYFYQKIKKLNI